MPIKAPKRATDGAILDRTFPGLSGRFTASSRCKRLSSSRRVCEHAFRSGRVQTARRLLATGEYDSDEVLNVVLDMVLENFRS